MNYKVLYRKYRPNDFEHVIGQDYIIKTLKNSIISKNFSHAYIFSGPRGTGKTSTAKIFAKAINCLDSKDGSPCGNCIICKNFIENPDIIEIDAASNNGVDEIRNLIDNIKLTPSNGKYKVYIIDEVHMLTQSAFNALLLTLEEPPSHAIFILATTNIESVPITILSRCQRFDFQKISIDDISNALKLICDKEKIKYNEDALDEIAELSEGGMRDALSILDQISKNGEKITIKLIEDQYKIVSKKNIDNLIDYIELNDTRNIITLIKKFKINSVDYKSLVKKIINELSNHARILKEKNQIRRLSFKDYKNLIIELSDTLTKVNINVDSYLILEMILLDYIQENQSNIIENKENKIKIELINNKNDSNEELKKIRINNCFVNAKKEFLNTAKETIKSLIDSIDVSGKIKSCLLDSNIVVASDEYIIFTCEHEHIADSINLDLKNIEKEIFKITNKNYKIIFIGIDRWNKEKMEYVNNKKNNKKYTYIEEKEDEKSNIKINDIFNKEKVQVI